MPEGKVYNFYKGSQNVEHIDKQINKYFYGSSGSDELTPETLKKWIDSVIPFFKTNRNWFSICKVLMIVEEVGDGDFESAAILIKSAYSDALPYDIDAKDISSLNVQSFRYNDIDKWDINDSPVTRGFNTYVTIAKRFLKKFEDA